MNCLAPNTYSAGADPFSALGAAGFTAGYTYNSLQANKVAIHDLATGDTGVCEYNPNAHQLTITVTVPGKTKQYVDTILVQSPFTTPANSEECSLTQGGSTVQSTYVGGDWQIDGGNLAGIYVGSTGLADMGTSTGNLTWSGSDGYQYSFSELPGFLKDGAGVLQITGPNLASDSLSEITVNDFNLSQAESASGDMGINLNGTLSLSGGANLGGGGGAPAFAEGSTDFYTLSANAPTIANETISVALTGAIPSDFEAIVGGSIESISGAGTFDVTLAAGSSNVSFGLVDTTPDNGTSDISKGGALTLSASLLNPDTLAGGTIQANTLTFNYTPEGSDTAPAPVTDSALTGVYNSTTGITTYTGDGLDDYIAAGGTSNLVNAQSSGNDSIIGGSGTNTINGGAGNSVILLSGTSDYVALGSGHNSVSGSSGHDTLVSNAGNQIISGNGGTDLILLGNGTNEVYALTKTSLANAIATASSGTPTHTQGDLITVYNGNNTVVGGNGNDLIAAGAGGDVVVMGPGNDIFVGGVEVTTAGANWSTTVTQTPTSVTLQLNNVGYNVESNTATYAQPYNGSTDTATNTPFGPANDTVFGGTGNDFFQLGNGNNYVQTGSGNDTVTNGVGNDTVITGSGNDFIADGGGSEYVAGGSGHDTIYGGDGNNTIIGGSGNSTIYSAVGPTPTYAGESSEQNYVAGGAGNDVIYGSGGQDTLIGGSGNTTLYGGSGTENIIGGAGNDLLVGGSGNDTLIAGGSGIDTLYAGGASTSASYVYGGTGKDLIVGYSGANILYAGDGGVAGAATTVFASQNDSTATTTISGGLGVDFLEAGSGATVINAGGGGTSGAPTTVQGWTGNDTLYGGSGTDIIQGGSGAAEALYGGDGGMAGAPTTVISGTGADTLFGGFGVSLLQDFSSGQDLIVSSGANDTMDGTGNDTLIAGTGNDYMQASGSSVSFEINPGFGADTLVALNGGAVNLLFGAGILATDFVGSIGFDTLGNSYLNLAGDGGLISIGDGLVGGLASAAYADPSSIPLPTLLTDAFGGDQTVSSGAQTFYLNLGNNESITASYSGDTVSSWGNDDTIAGALENDIYSTGSGALIGSGGLNQVVATGNNDTLLGGTYGGDGFTLTGGNSVADIGSPINGYYVTRVMLSGTNDTVVSGAGSSQSIITVNTHRQPWKSRRELEQSLSIVR
jgi:Ca2+-binding RTX toxin-like protein